MRKLFLLTLLTAGIFGCGGCFGSNPEAVIDYGAMPPNFILPIEMDKTYLIRRQGQEFVAEIKTNMFSSDQYTVVWNKINEKRSNMNVTGRTPYLIYVDGKDYIYLWDKKTSAIAYLDLNGVSYNGRQFMNVDNGSVKFYGEPTNPKSMLMATRMYNIGNCYAWEYYHVGRQGKPELNDTNMRYHYVAEEFRQQPVTLLQDIEVEVFADTEAAVPVKELLPKGTRLTRFRGRADDMTIVDLLLPDKRVARFYERYLFSEPTNYLDINGHSGFELFDRPLYKL